MWTNISILFNLGINTWLDIRKRQVSVLVVLLSLCIGICEQICETRIDIAAIICRSIPGLLCFVAAYITKEEIGYGDAWIILALGMEMQWNEFWITCVFAFGLAGLAAITLLFLFRKGRKYEMPFVPYLWMGYIITKFVV